MPTPDCSRTATSIPALECRENGTHPAHDHYTVGSVPASSTSPSPDASFAAEVQRERPVPTFSLSPAKNVDHVRVADLKLV